MHLKCLGDARDSAQSRVTGCKVLNKPTVCLALLYPILRFSCKRYLCSVRTSKVLGFRIRLILLQILALSSISWLVVNNLCSTEIGNSQSGARGQRNPWSPELRLCLSNKNNTIKWDSPEAVTGVDCSTVAIRCLHGYLLASHSPSMHPPPRAPGLPPHQAYICAQMTCSAFKALTQDLVNFSKVPNNKETFFLFPLFIFLSFSFLPFFGDRVSLSVALAVQELAM